MAPAGNMKKLLRKLSVKVVTISTSSCTSSAPYCRIQSSDDTRHSRRRGAASSSVTKLVLQLLMRSLGSSRSTAGSVVPAGHFPVHVGTDQEATQRFVVSANLLRHPAFVDLLEISAAEFGYGQTGVLRIPVRVLVFKRIVESLRIGQDPKQVCHWEDDFTVSSSLTSPRPSRSSSTVPVPVR